MGVLLKPLAEAAVAVCVATTQGIRLIEQLIADGASDETPHCVHV